MTTHWLLACLLARSRHFLPCFRNVGRKKMVQHHTNTKQHVTIIHRRTSILVCQQPPKKQQNKKTKTKKANPLLLSSLPSIQLHTQRNSFSPLFPTLPKANSGALYSLR